jgi:holin-like protein
LLFVPAGVGLIEHWDRLQSYGIQMLVIIALSTLSAALAMIAVFKLSRTKP